MLFSIGLAGALTRRNTILVLVGIELMLNAANLNLIAFWRFGPHSQAATGIIFGLFSIGVAAAEAAVGLGATFFFTLPQTLAAKGGTDFQTSFTIAFRGKA